LKQQGGKAYFNRYSAPIRDEHQIAVECGSGRYRLMLAYNRVSAEDSSEMARYEFEIYNPQYPPKVPRAAWINDPRNAKWEALLPKEAPAGAAGSLVDAMKVYGDIRREVRDELDDEPAAPTTSTSEVLSTMKLAKELFAPAAPANAQPATPADPFDTAKKIMDMRTNDPMIALLLARMDAQDKAAEAARQREYELLKEKAQPAEKPKTLMEQLTEFKALKDLFTNTTNGDTMTRVGRTGALDVVRDLGSKFFESDLASGVGQWLGSLAQRNMSNPAPSNMNGTPPVQVQQAAPDQFQAFIRDVLNPSLLRHYLQEFSGADFAGWLYDGYPDRLVQLQSFTHPMMPGLKGAPAIIQAYKRTDSMWPALSSRGEQAFADFVHQFCEWKPDTGVVDAEVIDTQPASDSEEEPERI
jgi:hypothetical protein